MIYSTYGLGMDRSYDSKAHKSKYHPDQRRTYKVCDRESGVIGRRLFDPSDFSCGPDYKIR